jgi:hypothetical protein
MIGAMVAGTAVGIAIFTSVATGAVSLAVTWATMRRSGVSGKGILAAIVPAWLMSCIAFAASYWLDGLLAGRSTPVTVRVVASSIVFVVIFCAAARLFIPKHLEEALSVMPRGIRGPVARLLRIGAGDVAVAGRAETVAKTTSS